MKIPSINEIRTTILNLPILSILVRWSQAHSAPGFFRVPLYDVIVFIIGETRRFNLTMRANSMAFSFFLSIFPTILVIFTLVPFILPYFSDFILPYISEDMIARFEDGSVNFNQTIMDQISALIKEVQVIPTNVHDQLIDFINGVALEPRFDVLSIGFLLAIYFASNGMMTMMRGFEKSHTSAFRKRSGWRNILISLWLTGLIGFLVVASVLLIILGNSLVTLLFDYWQTDRFTEITIQFLRWTTIFFLFYFVIAFIYRWGIATKSRVKYFSPGATLATILSILSSLLFAWYVNSFGAYNKLYGTIGTFIVIMIWIQINSFIILVGFELNAAIAVNRDLKKVLEKKKKEEGEKSLNFLKKL